MYIRKIINKIGLFYKGYKISEVSDIKYLGQ